MFGFGNRFKNLQRHYNELRECFEVMKEQRDVAKADNKDLITISENQHKMYQECKAKLESVKADNYTMATQIAALKERVANLDQARCFNDRATNYLGEMATRLAAPVERLHCDIKAMYDAYNSVGADWPWESAEDV